MRKAVHVRKDSTMFGSLMSACARERSCEKDARGTAWRAATRGRHPASMLRDSIWRRSGQCVQNNGDGGSRTDGSAGGNGENKMLDGVEVRRLGLWVKTGASVVGLRA